MNTEAAEVYEEFFLPALFGPWVARVADAARVRPGGRALDVACGTGVLARELAARVGPSGSVAGLDPNAAMLAVAARAAPGIEWVRGSAESMPFEDASFDAVASQFGLMFFEDPVRGIREMLRVLRPGGRLVVAVWGSLDDTPGYAAVTDLLERLFGAEVADRLRAPYSLGDPTRLRALFARAGALEEEIATVDGRARFPSIASWMHTDVRGWTLADAIDDEGFTRLLERAEAELRPFVAEDGTVAFRAPANLVTASKAA